MSRAWARRLTCAAAALAVGLSPLVVTTTAVAAEDPAVEAPAPESPAPAEGAEPPLVSGVEASKAALVRIETSAVAEIVHIDHSSGDVDLVRGRYSVPVASGTGVFVSADGVITTAGRNVILDEKQVGISAANQLFTDQLAQTLVGNDGDLSRRARSTDPRWDPHLQHCYDRVDHCVLFTVPQYEVFPYTTTGVSAPADLITAPGGPADVAVLRISGGGGTPTAELAPADRPAPAEALLTGFDQLPRPDLAAATMPVRADAATGGLSAEGDLGGALGNGMTGGAVLDPATGELAGLATTADDGAPLLIPAGAVRTALDAAGTSPDPSEFDAVFRRGLDHMASGHTPGSAVGAFEESLTYYDSALADQYLQRAREQAGASGQAASAAGADDGGFPGGPIGWLVLLLVAVLVAVAVALLLRRRRAAAGRRGGGGPGGGAPVPSGPAPGPPGAAAPTAAAAGGLTAARPAGSPAGEVPPPLDPTAEGRKPEPVSAAVSAVGAGSSAPGGTTMIARPPLRGAPPAAVPGAGSPPRPAPRSGDSAAGAAVPGSAGQPAFCSDCGQKLRDGARFCGACGARAD
ncbi:zinc-ribbon domain-containing protein [Modestobacter lapidis]|nr:zinc-ribbon domain-containing protein [Modestobacter lapidis]